MGSKNRIAKYIVPILEKAYYDNECEKFIDACCGGCNLIDKINPNIPRYANDYNEYIYSMWVELQKGWKPKIISKEEYNHIKQNKQLYKPFEVGYYGISASYSGTWFSGYAGEIITKEGIKRNYQKECERNVQKQLLNLVDVYFSNSSVVDIKPNQKALIYCDIPYKNTAKYKDEFPYEEFYKWCKEMKKEGHTIFISEYNMPSDFKEVWNQEINHSLSKAVGGNKKATEKLFTL